jgi:hypothetical protein
MTYTVEYLEFVFKYRNSEAGSAPFIMYKGRKNFYSVDPLEETGLVQWVNPFWKKLQDDGQYQK